MCAFAPCFSVLRTCERVGLRRPCHAIHPARFPLLGIGRALRTSPSATRSTGETSTRVDPSSLTTTGVAPTWDVRMLYDGACMLCKREVDFLRAKDANRNRVDFVDIDAPDYDPSINAGIEYETAMGTIHAITRDGRVITGVEVFRELYEAVGLGWIYAITRNKTVEKLANKVYDVWASNRLAITGRPELPVILAEKRTCRDNACEIPISAEERK